MMKAIHSIVDGLLWLFCCAVLLVSNGLVRLFDRDRPGLLLVVLVVVMVVCFGIAGTLDCAEGAP